MQTFILKTVADAMSKEVVTVSPDTKISELVALFEEHRFNMFPVVEAGKMIGVVSEYDFLKIFIFTNKEMLPKYDHLLKKTVSEVISSSQNMSPDQPLTRVLELMVQSMYRSFPVVDAAGDLVGVIARRDLIKALGI